MSQEFYIQMKQNGSAIDFSIYPNGLAGAGVTLAQRQTPLLLPTDIEQLRQGEADLPTTKRLAGQTSQWLLGPDLLPHLEAAYNNLGQAQLRVIFQVDEQLRNDPTQGDRLADMPFELLTLPTDIVPLALSPRVAAFVHRLSKVSSAQASPLARTPPLRVLIVHSNPARLGGAVPYPAPIRERILQLGQQIGPDMVEVDLLSRQPVEGVIGLPTSDGLRKALRDEIYDILVYLGHGGREEGHTDLLPLAFLYLESADGTRQDPVRADVLASELQNNPVPVVLLVGCLTAADVPAANWADVRASLPGVMRGNQGMAQALVNSSSGVQVSVGMRGRLESEDAQDFLEAFFESLLQESPGNVDAAVHEGRERLLAANRSPASFSAPVLYRVLAPEPFFGFLESPKTVVVPTSWQDIRSVFWRVLPRLSAGNPAELQRNFAMTVEVDNLMVEDVGKHAALLIPELRQAQQNGPVTVPVRLAGSLTVSELEGVLVVDSPEAHIDQVRTSSLVKASDYRMLSDVDGNRVTFHIERKHKDQGPIPPGPVMEVTVSLGPSAGMLYPVAIDIVKISPKRAICPVNNVIVVPAV
jgi:hypothetical protein